MGESLKLISELVAKFAPATNSPIIGPPAARLDGLIIEMAGAKDATGNSTDVEAPPPGSGLNTKTTAVPSLLISEPRMLAFSCVDLTNVVMRNWPPK